MKMEWSCGAVPHGTVSSCFSPDSRPGLMNAVTSRLVLAAVLAAVMAGAGCSSDAPVAASKAPVTVDPDVFSVERPELFKTAKAEMRELPTELTVNGTVTPDVTRTIHVTSLGGGRVIDLKAKTGGFRKERRDSAGDFES